MRLPKEAWNSLLQVAEENNLYIEGNILNVLDPGDNAAAAEYLADASKTSNAKRQKRLEVTKKAQQEQRELKEANEQNTKLMAELTDALQEAKLAQSQAEEAREESDRHRRDAEEARILAEKAKTTAESDLDFMQKQKQFRLINQIVRSSIYVICGVGLITSALYVFLIVRNADESQISMMGNTWSNMFGILLTNSFSIIGTVMGVKYATDKGSGE